MVIVSTTEIFSIINNKVRHNTFVGNRVEDAVFHLKDIAERLRVFI